MLTLDEIKGKHIAVCTPCYGGKIDQNYFMSVIKLLFACQAHDILLSFVIRGGDSLIPRIRNSMVAEFMATTDASHLLWIDADIGFEPEAVLRLLMADREVCAGVYPMKSINWPEHIPAQSRETFDATYARYPFNPIGGRVQMDADGMIEVLDAPTGLMMIKREVIDKMIAAYPDLRIVADAMPGLEHIADKIEQYNYRFFDVMTEPNGRYLSEDYAFCTSAATRVETEDGVRSMKWIVDNKYAGRVKSLDANGEFVWNRVIDRWSTYNGRRGDPASKKRWVRIDTDSCNNVRSKLRVTDDHQVLVVRNIMRPEREFLPAGSIAGLYAVRHPEARANHRVNPLFNQEQMSVVVGCLLGDGSIGRNGQFTVTHSTKQRAYLLHKARLLGAAVEADCEQTGFSTGKHFRVRMGCPVNAQTRYLREISYAPKKSVAALIPYIDEIALAYWFMDDGSINGGGCATLHTNGFAHDEQNLLIEMFRDRWDIEAKIQTKSVTYKGQVRTYETLSFGAGETRKLHALVAPYVIPEMEYKLRPEFRGGDKRVIDPTNLGFAATRVRAVTPLPQHSSRLYDLTVENDHNFVADGTVIHNCRRWQAIGGQIFVDAASNLTHQGSYIYKGNFLESLKIRISEVKAAEAAEAAQKAQQAVPTVSDAARGALAALKSQNVGGKGLLP